MTQSFRALLFALAIAVAIPLASAQEKVHGANSVFVAPTVKIAWAVQKGPSEDTTLVTMRVVNSAGEYKQVRLDGVDPFSDGRKVLVPMRSFGTSADLSVRRASFADFPSCEIHLYRSDAAAGDTKPSLTVYYLGVPDTTPEFATAPEAAAYLAKTVGP